MLSLIPAHVKTPPVLAEPALPVVKPLMFLLLDE